jgi:hypothetical protein
MFLEDLVNHFILELSVDEGNKGLLWHGLAFLFLGTDVSFHFLQDDTYTESYISTIGVDFVSMSFDTKFILQ